MNISPLLSFARNINNYSINNPCTFFGFRLNQLQKDTVSFTSNEKTKPKKKQVIKSYSTKSTIKKVKQYLKSGNALLALMELGYDVCSDPESAVYAAMGFDVGSDFKSAKITIKGDYIPYFIEKDLFVKDPDPEFISYKDAGIDEDKLLENVEKIGGIRLHSPLESELNDKIKIDPEEKYPLKTALLFAQLLKIRAKRALENDDCEKALNIFGFKTSTNKKGDITIIGDYSYSHRFMKASDSPTSLEELGIDENKLLKKVTEITGHADFGDKFKPDKYIETKDFSLCGQSSGSKFDVFEKQFELLNPRFVKYISNVNEQIKAGDMRAALKLLEHRSKKSDDGLITIYGGYSCRMYSPFRKNVCRPHYYYFNELGIDEKGLFEKVKDIKGDANLEGSSLKSLNNIKIDGNLYLKGSNLKSLDNIQISGNLYLEGSSLESLDNIKIDGDLYIKGSKIRTLGKNVQVNGVINHEDIDPKTLFSKYIDRSVVLEQYGNIDEDILKGYANCLRSDLGNHYVYFDKDAKRLLDYISQNRNRLLTVYDLQRVYGISPMKTRSLFKTGQIKAFGKKEVPEKYPIEHLLFDIEDEKSNKALIELTKPSSLRIENPDEYSVEELSKEVHELLQRKQYSNEYNINNKRFPAKKLEEFGYGRKQDILYACAIRSDFLQICDFILRNDFYDITPNFMMNLLDVSRKNNPAVATIKELRSAIGLKKYKELLAAIINLDIDVIACDVSRWTNSDNYCVDLFSGKNYKFLSNIDNHKFKRWLVSRKRENEEYKAKNDDMLNKILNAKDLSLQQREELQQELANDKKERIEAKKAAAIAAKKEYLRIASLKMTLAWYFSPSTRQVMSKLMDPYICELMDREKELKKLKNQVLLGEITEDEYIKALNEMKELSAKERTALFGYFKSVWDAAGTKEFSAAREKAGIIADTYFESESGADAIEDEGIRQKILKWEEKWKKKFGK